MSDTLTFKCPCCGATLGFNGGTGELTCEYCGAGFTVEQAKAAQAAEQVDAAASDMTWSAKKPSLIRDEEGRVSGYRCTSCGAEMVCDDKTAATECPYCGNNAIIHESFDGLFRPDLVVPFSVDKKTAQQKLRDFYQGKKLLPDSFLDQSRIENMTGLYVPFWLMSCHAEGAESYEGVREQTSRDDRYEYTKRDYYRVDREGRMDFDRIPVDASTKMDDATMDSLEPYDVSKAVQYDAAYFSGYLADRYDVDAAMAQPRAGERVENTFREELEEEAKKHYDSLSRTGGSLRLSDTRTEYAMLPVWMLSTRFEGKIYSFAMNGQTGQVAGSLPIDQGKYKKAVALTSVIAAVILAALVFLLGGRTFHPVGTVIAVLAGVLIGFLRGSSLKSSMNTVAAKHKAGSYLRGDSRHITTPRPDRFLYTKTDKRELPKSSSQAQPKAPPSAPAGKGGRPAGR